jgi:hypothetical protein
MITVVHRLTVGLHHPINFDASKARSSVPTVTNSQVKRSRLLAWRASCPESWCPHDLQAGSRSLDIAGHGRDQQSELQGIQSGPGPRTHHIASAVLPSLVNPDSVILTG